MLESVGAEHERHQTDVRGVHGLESESRAGAVEVRLGDEVLDAVEHLLQQVALQQARLEHDQTAAVWKVKKRRERRRKGRGNNDEHEAGRGGRGKKGENLKFFWAVGARKQKRRKNSTRNDKTFLAFGVRLGVDRMSWRTGEVLVFTFVKLPSKSAPRQSRQL